MSPLEVTLRMTFNGIESISQAGNFLLTASSFRLETRVDEKINSTLSILNTKPLLIQEPEYLNIVDAQLKTKMSENELKDLCEQKALIWKKEGENIFILKDSLEEYFQ